MARSKKNRRNRSARAAWRLAPASDADTTDAAPGPFAGVPLQERMSGLQAPVEGCPDEAPDHPSWAW